MNATPHALPIALVGVSGAGKSTVAPLLAARLHGAHADLDARIEHRAALRIRELFATRGEVAFRELEAAELGRALDEGACVIACGGGIVETAAARQLLVERCHTVWLEVDVSEALRRMGEGRDERPLLGADPDPWGLANMLSRRAAKYAEVASSRVRTDGLTAHEVAERIVRAVEAWTSGSVS